ncbi:MAG TPA: hypothetical protein VEY70_10095 [Metabacillus sp.]|nr:hypothetical protein [Metabacillus sp.]
MIFELTTSMLAGGLVGFSYYKKNGGASKDHEKIVRIARNCGLVNKEGKEIRIFRRSKKSNYTEYVYQMPQGLSEQQFLDKINNFQDGLNIKKILYIYEQNNRIVQIFIYSFLVSHFDL